MEESGVKDGQYEVKSDFSSNTAGDVGAFLVIGKESAAAGRPRDAEVAFLMSCRLANQFQGEASLASADARYQLGRHYAQAAMLATEGPYRAELLKRAELLYSQSVQIYRTAVGEQHEKYRFAFEGLQGLNQQPAPLQSAALPTETASGTSSSRLPSRAGVEPVKPPGVARAPAALPRGTDSAAVPKPSFNCNQARSISEKIICSDAELAQLDRELGSLYVRAKSRASNPAAFKRQSDAQWLRREATCRDKRCLMDWYAQRREQLIAIQQER